MNYQRLLYFKTVAEHQHFTKAANELFITQSALTKAIQNLENDLGVSLFEKDGRNVILTKYGETFYDYVRRSLDEVDRGIQAVRHMRDLDSNTVFINALFSMYSFYLPEKILNFRKLYSDCRFSIGYHYTSEILNSVLNNQYELGICGNFEPSGKFSSIDYCTLYKEPIRFIVGREHPFAKREKVSVDELKNESFIVYFRSYWGTNKIIYDMCESAGFEPNIVAEGYNDFGVINLVASGEGIAIIPASGYLNSDSVVSINIDYDIPLTRDINVIWNTNESLPAIVSKFRDTLISQSAVAPVSLS